MEIRSGPAADPWGARTPYGRGDSWPVRVDSFLAPGTAPDAAQILSAL
ncbi:hypothetical protein [Kitasatospora purpeofusca]|nr:hypothetical protein [Kitasatospora purpeofusca]MCX4755401.1 hypothetical protein [Kitasatospora purpeofusca]WSR36726.1 hypothetical protein OG715_40630 [Kitasatospora purpeofusca]WSR45007.1 hypothetical protein OG196_41500 [Kitasatospora purpeofusca]